MHLGKEQSTGIAVDNGDAPTEGAEDDRARRDPRERRPAAVIAEERAPAATS